MQYIIVESISAFKYAEKKFRTVNICWTSSSPKVCNFFSINKLNFIEIEKLVTQKELDEIEKISKNICEAIISESNDIFKKKKYFELRFIAGAQILKKIHSIIYKTYLLNKLLSKTKKNIICIGNSDLSFNANFLGMGIFDNIFAVIGSCFKKKIDVIEYKENIIANKKNFLTNGSSNYFFLTKIISSLNSNYSVFLYKIYKHLVSVNYFRKFLNKKDKKQLLIIRETDHIAFSFTKLLKKFSIIFFNESFSDVEKKINQKKNITLNNKFQESYNNINYKIIKYFKNSSLKKNQIINYEKGLKLVSIQVFQYLQSVEINFLYIENKFKKILLKYKKEFCIITNNSLSQVESIFASYCQNIGIKMFSFEHGLRGMSKNDKSFKNYYEQYKGNFGVYYWKKSIKHSYSLINQTKIIDGFPYNPNKNFLKIWLSRILIKINFKLPILKNTIVFLSDLERNNDNFPNFTNDFNIVKNNKEIIRFLAKKYPKKIIVLKLYSTQKYLDIYNYQDLAKEFKNVRILRDISFDYLVDVFDEIYVSHASGTLLRCMNSTAKVYFLKLSNKEVYIKPFIKKKIIINNKNIYSCYLLNKKLSKISYNWINFLT